MLKIKKLLIEYFKSKPSVLAAYVFGSQTTGAVRRSSDIDIAVLLAESASKKAFELQLQWTEELSRLFEKEVDLVIINESDPFLKFQIYSKGLLIFTVDRRAAEDHKWKSIAAYWDWQPSQRILEGNSFYKTRKY